MPRCARISCPPGPGWACCACTPRWRWARERGCWPAGMPEPGRRPAEGPGSGRGPAVAPGSRRRLAVAPEHRAGNGDNEAMGTAQRTGRAQRELRQQLSRFRSIRYRSNWVSGRALRELTFCAIEGPLGVLVLLVLVALPLLGLLVSVLVGGG